MVFIPRCGLLSDNIVGLSLSKEELQAGMRSLKAPRHRGCFAIPKLREQPHTTSGIAIIACYLAPPLFAFRADAGQSHDCFYRHSIQKYNNFPYSAVIAPANVGCLVPLQLDSFGILSVSVRNS